MKLIEVKTAKDMDLGEGVKVEFVTEGGTLKGVIVTGPNKRIFHLKPGPSYSEQQKVFEQIEHEMAEKWKMWGDVLGLNVIEYFDKRAAADARLAELIEASPEANLKIVQVQVKVDDTGLVVSPPGDDMPF